MRIRSESTRPYSSSVDIHLSSNWSQYTLSFYQIEPWKHKSQFKRTASLKILPPFLWSCDKSNDILKSKPTNKNGFSNRKGVMLVVVVPTSSIFNVNIFILKNENTWDLKGFLTNKLLKGKKVNSNFCPRLVKLGKTW